jgi:hypothetical protein
MKVRRHNGNLTITIPLLEEPRLSNSRKSMLIASSFGVRKSKLKFDGQAALYVANVFFYPSGKTGSASVNAKKTLKKNAAASKNARRH